MTAQSAITAHHGAALVRRMLDFDLAARQGALVAADDSQLFEPRRDLLIGLLMQLLDHPTAPRGCPKTYPNEDVHLLHKVAASFLREEVANLEVRLTELLLARAEPNGALTVARAEREWLEDLTRRLGEKPLQWAEPTDYERTALVKYTHEHVVAVITAR